MLKNLFSTIPVNLAGFPSGPSYIEKMEVKLSPSPDKPDGDPEACLHLTINTGSAVVVGIIPLRALVIWGLSMDYMLTIWTLKGNGHGSDGLIPE